MRALGTWGDRAALATALLAGPPAYAQDALASWEMLSDAMLLLAADNDAQGATAILLELSRNLGTDDPIRSEALLWLARTRYEDGDVEGSREALRECVRTGVARDRCLELLWRIELEQSSVREVPVHWTFDDQAHGFVHPLIYADMGAIRIERDTADGNPVLAWMTRVDPRGDDQIVVGFDEPSPPPRRIAFLVRSTGLDAFIRVQVHDIHGHRFTTRPDRAPFHLPPGETVRIEIDLALAVGEDPERVTLDPGAVDRLVIQDVTAFFGDRTGQNTLLLDDFQVQ